MQAVKVEDMTEINERAQGVVDALDLLDSAIFVEFDDTTHPVVIAMQKANEFLCEALDAIGTDYRKH
jgi:hypothetical protein